MTLSGAKNTSEKSEEFRNDGALINALTGMGTLKRDKAQYTTIRPVRLLSATELEMLYAVGLPRRFVDAIPDCFLKHRTTIKLSEDTTKKQDLIKKFEQYLKDIRFHQAYSEVVRLQRLYGGAVLVLLLDDGVEDPSEPVNIKRLRGIRGILPLSRHDIFPEDYSVMDYSNPTYYRITTQQRISPDQPNPTTNIRIHSSRIIRFDGLYLPWRVRQNNQGWGQAAIQVIWDAWKRYETSIAGLETMITESSTFWHKIPGLFEMLKQGREAELIKRMEVNNLSRSIYRGMMLDGQEEIGFSERSLNNLATAMAPFAEYLQATTGWPASILMGSSPGGLGKEGRFEERVWASLVEQWQTVYCHDGIETLFRYCFAAKEGPTGGTDPEDWEVSFPSTFVETPMEKAQLRQAMSTADSTDIVNGVVTALEVRNSRYGGAEYSVETTLDDDVSDQLQMKADMTFENEMMGMEAQANQMQGLDVNGNPLPTDPTTGQPLPPGSQPPPPEGAPPGGAPGAPAGSETQETGSENAPAQADPEVEALFNKTPDPAAKKAPAKKTKTDRYDALDIDVEVLQERGNILLGIQTRNDSDPSPVILGPHRKRAYRYYKADLRTDTGQQKMYLTGFASMKAAKRALLAFFPEQTDTTISPELAPFGGAAE